MDNIALIVHGGAGQILPHRTDSCLKGVRRALDRGWAILKGGGSALDTCEQAIIEMEDDPVFDAGVGSHLNRDGKPQLDAILMDGASLRSGAIAAVERIRNPIQLARAVLEKSPHMLLVAEGAERFAIENGIDLCDPKVLITEYEQELWSEKSKSVPSSGTVGAVALDALGDIASGTSTGGTFYKFPGRVGDSPLVGCGCYADNLCSGVSTTGQGEAIMKVVLAKTASDYVAGGASPQKAAEDAIALLGRRTDGRGGLIMLDRTGRFGVAFSTPDMSYAFRSPAGHGPSIR